MACPQSLFAFLTEHGPTLLLGTVTTIKVLVCSAILYVIISMIFGLMRLSKNPAIQGIATVYIEFFRGTSLLVQLFWVYYEQIVDEKKDLQSIINAKENFNIILKNNFQKYIKTLLRYLSQKLPILTLTISLK